LEENEQKIYNICADAGGNEIREALSLYLILLVPVFL